MRSMGEAATRLAICCCVCVVAPSALLAAEGRPVELLRAAAGRVAVAAPAPAIAAGDPIFTTSVTSDAGGGHVPLMALAGALIDPAF